MAVQTSTDLSKLERIAATFRAGEPIYAAQGSPLYAALSKAGADDELALELASQAMAGAPPVHLFTSAHYLLLGGLDDPLARFFPTLTSDPAPPEEAWPVFRRFCEQHREELSHLLRTRPIQMTYVERCRTLLPPMCLVADEAGEPLNIIEIGCSAGVLLTFDSYAYELREGERVGPADAPFLLKGELHGGPALRMPRIGTRTGIDLNVIDARSEDDRRWMLATCFPELLTEQARLAQAMDIVARTDIRWLEGDALELIDQALEHAPDPVCVYHSACLFYWPQETRAALDERLRQASRNRTIHRFGVEPSERFNDWQRGKTSPAGNTEYNGQPTGEITLGRYRGGEADIRVVAHSGSNFGSMWWLD